MKPITVFVGVILLVVGGLGLATATNAATIFTGPTNYASGGSGATGLFVGLFNYSDEIIDIGVVNTDSDTFSLFLGNGDGTFGSSGNFAVGDVPYFGAAGDFNDDEFLDVAVTNNGGANAVTVAFGNGSGSFVGATSYGLDGSPANLTVVGDFNEDGDPDLAICAGSTLVIYSNDGAGTFNASSTVPNLSGCNDVETVDIDDDDNLDLVTTHSDSSDNVHVLFGNGDGTFDAPATYTAGTDVLSVVVVDVDQDDDLDLVAGNFESDYISVFLNNGSGVFGAATNFTAPKSFEITSGDFNNDGDVDIAAGNWASSTISVLLGNGNGTFATADLYGSVVCTTCFGGMLSGDFNGDDITDLAVSKHDGVDGFSVFLNQLGDGSTVLSTSSVSVVEDGSSDQVSYTLPVAPSTTVQIHLTNTGQTIFSQNTLTFTPANYNIAQTLTVYAVDDIDIEGAHGDTITHTITSADPAYDGYMIGDVAVTITDNDPVPVTDDFGGSAYPVNLNDPPIPPDGGFRFTINHGESATNQALVQLDITTGPDTTAMIFSADATFSRVGIETVKTNRSWQLCLTCQNRLYTIYAKFYTKWGVASPVVAQSITYTGPADPIDGLGEEVAISGGELFRTQSNPAVYLVTNGQRKVYMNLSVYQSWFDHDFSGVTFISESQLYTFPFAGVVLYRPGSLIKITTDPKVYVVGVDYRLEWVPSEAQARLHYGADWAHQVQDVADVDFAAYGFNE